MTLVELSILRVLDEQGGFVTGDVADRAGMWRSPEPDNRAASIKARRALLDLQARGLVAPMDDQKPIAWVRTRAGTDAMASAAA